MDTTRLKKFENELQALATYSISNIKFFGSATSLAVCRRSYRTPPTHIPSLGLGALFFPVAVLPHAVGSSVLWSFLFFFAQRLVVNAAPLTCPGSRKGGRGERHVRDTRPEGV